MLKATYLIGFAIFLLISPSSMSPSYQIPYYSSGSPQEAAINQASAPSPSQTGTVNLEDRRKYYLKPIPLPSSDTTKYSTAEN